MKDRLEKFRIAQQADYETALQEIQSGQKKSHWMWYIFPQIAGLGMSETARYYAIEDIDEAKEYLEDKFLGGNLIEISKALLKLESNDARYVMGSLDHLKLKSSMTLFSLAQPECNVFQMVLDKFFDGENDLRTIEILSER